MKVSIYARVSTGVQSVDLQITELTAYAARMGWNVVDTYVDEGVSGTQIRGQDSATHEGRHGLSDRHGSGLEAR